MKGKYLVVRFDRYDTDRSKYELVESDSHLNAFKACKLTNDWEVEDWEEMLEGTDRGEFNQVDEFFACVSGEEEDYLIYVH